MFRKNRKADKQSNDTKHTERNIVGRGNAEEEPKLEKGDLTAMLIAAVGVVLTSSDSCSCVLNWNTLASVYSLNIVRQGYALLHLPCLLKLGSKTIDIHVIIILTVVC